MGEPKLPALTDSAPVPTRSVRLRASESEMGRVDTLRHNILTYVSNEEYSRAVTELKEYLDAKHEYPQFKTRAARYINYCVDLVNGIKAKKSFPGLHTLSMSKQQELYDKSMEHFDDLKISLRKIEQIEKDVRLEDVRSTVWVVQALVYSLFAILLIAFMIEVSRGVLDSAGIVLDDIANKAVNWLFAKLGA